MIRLFGFSIHALTSTLLIITVVIIGGVVLLALFNRIFFKIGVRNIPRRRMQMVLIVFALMLSTTLLSSVLATGDILNATVQSVAVYNWGNIDELIEGGQGPLGLFPDRAYYRLQRQAQRHSEIAAVGAALKEQGLLVADQTSRQVRSQVSALAVLPGSERGFGGLVDQGNKQQLTIAGLHADEVYINQTAAQLMNAHRGDILYLYKKDWPGKRYTARVAAIVGNDGLVSDLPSLISQAEMFQTIEGKPRQINQIYVANRGGGGVSGVGLSDEVTDLLNQALPYGVHVIQVKEQGVQVSQYAQDIFARVFALFALFALAIGLLLIFLIFVLLAAERRAEMGMARAIGVQRRHLIFMFLFEGTVYDLLSSFVGLLFGIGGGVLLVFLLQPLLARFNFPLKLSFQPDSLIVAFCLGVIFTFLSVALSSWLVSRMTVVEALRDLPEAGQAPATLPDLGRRLVSLVTQLGQAITGRGSWRTLRDSAAAMSSKSAFRRARLRRIRRILFAHFPDLLLDLIRSLVMLGFLPLLAGLWLMQQGLEQEQIIPFSLGFSLIVVGLALFLRALFRLLGKTVARLYQMMRREQSMPELLGGRWRAIIHGFSPLALIVGSVVVAYWALPFDVLLNFGLPRFQGGIEIFFVAGVMMVLGAVWVLVANAALLVRPLLALCAQLPGFYAVTKLASSYPLHRRVRTGLSIVMFSMVVFAMTVMAVITNAMQGSYADVNQQTGGYDIQATAYFTPLPDMQSSLVQHGIDPHAFSSIGMRSTTAVGVMQLSASTPRWTIYPAQIVNGGFLQGYGLHLKARAQGFASDSDVWKAMQQHPDYALIDSSALPYDPNTVTNAPVYDPSSPQASDAGAPSIPPGFDARYAFAMSGVYQGETTFKATPLWITGAQQGRQAIKVTVIGVVDNSDATHYGLYLSHSSYSAQAVAVNTDGSTPEAVTYYFKVAPGQDKRALALALGSAYLDNGLETTVLEDVIYQVRGPRILLSNVLLGVVGMVLLLGVAALAITGTRAVVERRQQIGMLRALGCPRWMIQMAFLLESFMIGIAGSLLGIVLGLILARNIFAANFFEQYQTGLVFSIPWSQLGVIIGISFVASFLGAVLPAWQSGKIAPAEALRYA